MILVTLSILVTVGVLNIHFRSPATHRMSPWVSTKQTSEKNQIVEFFRKNYQMTYFRNNYVIQNVIPFVIPNFPFPPPWRGRCSSVISVQNFPCISIPLLNCPSGRSQPMAEEHEYYAKSYFQISLPFSFRCARSLSRRCRASCSCRGRTTTPSTRTSRARAPPRPRGRPRRRHPPPGPQWPRRHGRQLGLLFALETRLNYLLCFSTDLKVLFLIMKCRYPSTLSLFRLHALLPWTQYKKLHLGFPG